MKRKLTAKDRKQLKTATRMGYVFGAFVLIPVAGVFITSELGIIANIPIYLLLAGSILAFLITWLINRKYWADLRNSEKEIIKKKVGKKESKKEYEAGSSVGLSVTGKKSPFYHEMASYMEYSIIVDHVRYRIEKEIWDVLQENDEVEFHYAPKSKDLLDIKSGIY